MKIGLRMMPRTSRTVAFCSVANFINAADRVLMPIAIIPMTDEFKWNLHLQGWVLSSFAFGYFTSQLAITNVLLDFVVIWQSDELRCPTPMTLCWVLGVHAAKKYGGKRMLTMAVFLWSLSTLVTPLVASSIYLVILSRVVLGLGEGLGLPIIFDIFAHTIPVEERSRSFAYLVAFGSIGQTIAAVVCPHLPWRWMFNSFGILGILWVILWLLCYKENHQSYDGEIPLVFSKVANTNVRWSEFIFHWPLWAIYIAHFSMNWSNYIIMQWLPTYLARNLGANQQDISLTAVPYIMNSLFGMGHFADSLISSKWTVLSVRRLMTSIGLLGPGIFLLCFCTVSNLLAAVVFVSISMGLCACNSAGHLSNHADIAPNHAGVTFAISNSLATIPGILCGPLTAELVTQSHGRWFPVFVLAALINFVGAIIFHSQSSANQVL